MQCLKCTLFKKLCCNFNVIKLCYSTLRNSFPSSLRTHRCGELRLVNVGEKITICGWVQHTRSKRFIVVRDWTGAVQVIADNFGLINVALESVVSVNGIVKKRPVKDYNENMSTGKIEIDPDGFKIINECSNLPFLIHDKSNKLESTRLHHRYLDIRTSKMQHNLRLRSRIIHHMRNFFIEKDFVEIETPTLFRPTPGGAKEFVVPLTKDPGKYYALVQSPQQFKQLLMVGGIDRYFQIARCYRDEVIMSDRQPEFTQLDVEMSFVNQNDIMNVTENMIKKIWPYRLPESNFKVMTYNDALNTYGSDKPDIRFDLTLKNITSHFKDVDLFKTKSVKAIIVPANLSNNFMNKLHESVTKLLSDENTSKFAMLKVENGIVKSSGIAKHFTYKIKEDLPFILQANDNDTIIFAWGSLTSVNKTLGKVRLMCQKMLNSNKETVIKMSNNLHEFLWVTEFPLFELKDNKLSSVHHPFTSPHPEDLHLLNLSPLKVRSLAFDLVLNGQEIGGGSIRIHNSDFQREIFNKYLKTGSDDFEHLLAALSAGAPPHGGIALGLDRLFAILCNADSIRDVIAFPKSANGKDLMGKAPISLDYFNNVFNIFST